MSLMDGSAFDVYHGEFLRRACRSSLEGPGPHALHREGAGARPSLRHARKGRTRCLQDRGAPGGHRVPTPRSRRAS